MKKIEKIIKYFEEEPPIYPLQDTYRAGDGCYIGADIAFLLYRKHSNSYIYDALIACLREMGFKDANAAHVFLILRELRVFGEANFSEPFGSGIWKREPIEVFKEFAEIKRLPITAYINYSNWENMCYLDLRGGDFRHSIFKRSEIFHTNFKGANLEYASFYLNHTKNSNFREANLKNAYFRYELIEESDFKGADLTDVKCTSIEFINTNYHDFKDAKLEDCKTNKEYKCSHTI